MNKLIPLLLMTFLQVPGSTALAQNIFEINNEQIKQEEVDQVREEVKKEVKEEVQKEVQKEKEEVKEEVKKDIKEDIEEEVQKELDEKFKDNNPLTRQIPDSTALILGTAILFSSLLIGLTIYTPLHSIEKQRCEQQNMPLTTMDDRTEFVNKVLPKVVEGITVYLIVAVVSILSLSGTIQPQGTITILASISGYVLGRQNQNDPKSGTESKPYSPVNREQYVLETSKELTKTSNGKKVDHEKKSEVNFSKAK